MSTINLKETLTTKNLRALASVRSFGRGEEYYEDGAVGSISEKSGVISAKVRGSRTYDVRLKVVPNEKGKAILDHSCSCPVGRDGVFCKHCVALGLAWLEKEAENVAPSSDESKKPILDSNIRTWLAEQGSKVILDILMAQLAINGRLREDIVPKSCNHYINYC